jgi:hypothetical protein
MSKHSSNKSKWAAFMRPDGSFDFEALSAAQKEDLYRECAMAEEKDAWPLTTAQHKLHSQVRRRGRSQKRLNRPLR